MIRLNPGFTLTEVFKVRGDALLLSIGEVELLSDVTISKISFYFFSGKTTE